MEGNLEHLTELSEDIKDSTDKLLEITSDSFWSQSNLINVGVSLLKGILIFVVGYLLIRYALKLINHILKKGGATKSAIYYIEIIFKFLGYFFVIVIAANTMGFQTNSLITLVASLGLSIALALRGSLTALASGIMIVLTRLIKAGDRVFIEGTEDLLVVEEIRLFNTIFKNRKNITVVLPNEKIMQNKVENLSKTEYVYTDVKIGIPLKDDIEKARQIIKTCLDNNDRVLKGHDYIIGVSGTSDSCIDILVSAPVVPEDYIIMQFELREVIMNKLKENGIMKPVLQREIRLL